MQESLFLKLSDTLCRIDGLIMLVKFLIISEFKDGEPTRYTFTSMAYATRYT